MKKLIVTTLAIVSALAFSVNSSAQLYDGARVGIIGGLTSSSASVKNLDASSISQYHAGLAAQFPLGAGFAIQPALIYQVKGTTLEAAESVSDFTGSLDMKLGYLELPVQLQWGPDLVAFRPYGFLEPFVGYRLTENTSGSSSVTKDDIKDGLKKVEYGLGVGAGIEIWKLQISARYFWNFGQIYETGSTAKDVVKDAFDNGNNFNGIAFSLAFLF